MVLQYVMTNPNVRHAAGRLLVTMNLRRIKGASFGGRMQQDFGKDNDRISGSVSEDQMGLFGGEEEASEAAYR